MKLEGLIQNFHLDETERQKINESDSQKSWSDEKGADDAEKYVPQSFENIARCLLAGHFEVRSGNEVVRRVYPKSVEIYYHEEQGERAVKDYIVYHRNGRMKNDGRLDLFELGTFNAHQSGLDITFEHRTMVGGDEVEVRASALIRAFKVEVVDPRYGVETAGLKECRTDRRSTYLYNALFSNVPVLKGFSIAWTDGEAGKVRMKRGLRKNVPPYEVVGNRVCKIEDGGIKNDGRYWQFSIDE